ncbi:hypothetical protein Scep_017221 [Stephania cephalantha]|uniref:Uncharacterized protein n=1 Tax=Stephania cephalantha TaxID=152367 RepID=A0AAP0IP38_9MAGN
MKNSYHLKRFQTKKKGIVFDNNLRFMKDNRRGGVFFIHNCKKNTSVSTLGISLIPCRKYNGE